MALLDSELRRCRYELGYNLLSVGAEVYIDYHAVFDQVVAVYLQAGAKTTSSTSVASADAATPRTITLSDATGFSAGDVVIIDVDDRQERVTIESVSGSTITVLLRLAHGTGPYPVTVEGGEAIIRQILRRLYDCEQQLADGMSTAGIKRVDEIEFFGDQTAISQFSTLFKYRMHWRDELASALGVQNLWRRKSGGSSVTVY